MFRQCLLFCFAAFFCIISCKPAAETDAPSDGAPASAEPENPPSKEIKKFAACLELEKHLKGYNGNPAQARTEGGLLTDPALKSYSIPLEPGAQTDNRRLIASCKTKSGFELAALFIPNGDFSSIELILLKNGKATTKSGIDEMGMGQASIAVVRGKDASLISIADKKPVAVVFRDGDSEIRYVEQDGYFHPQ